MAGSVNKVILVGNLGKDPEIRPYPGRTSEVANLAHRHLKILARQVDRAEAQREDRVALESSPSTRTSARSPKQVPEGRAPRYFIEGRAADPQVAGPGRPGPLLDRGRAAGLQLAR